MAPRALRRRVRRRPARAPGDATKIHAHNAARRSQRGRQSPQEHGAVGRRESEAAQDRLHRSPLSARLGLHDAGRGDHARHDDLVRAGKSLCRDLRHARQLQIARMQTIADLRGWSPLIALEIGKPDRAHGRALLDPDGARAGPRRHPLVAAAVAWLTGKYTRVIFRSPTAVSPLWQRRTIGGRQRCAHERGWRSRTW